MRIRRTSLAGGVAIALLMSACSANATLTVADNGRIFSLPAQSQITVDLRGLPAPATPQASVLVITSSNPVVVAPAVEPMTPGAPTPGVARFVVLPSPMLRARAQITARWSYVGGNVDGGNVWSVTIVET